MKVPQAMSPSRIVGGIPAEGWSAIDGHPLIFSLEFAREKVTPLENLTLIDLERYVALHRDDPWFLRPAWGNTESDFPDTECQLVLWRRRDGLWGVIVPTAQGNRRAWIQRGEGGLSLRVRGTGHEEEPGQLCLLLIGVGNNPAKLVEDTVTAAINQLRTARVRSEKATPAWVDLLGWCTWDAFYREVSASRIEAGLAAFARDEVPVPLLIIDDGWQQTRDEQLLSFSADPVKFPGGLSALVEAVKSRHGVSIVGVWHALVGYWNGVHPEGKLGARYRLCPSCHGAYNFPKGRDIKRSLIHPDDIHRFYHDFHSYLRSQKVDMVKIDNQSSFDHFTENIVPDYLASASYQAAMQGTASFYFANNLLHCMAMSADIAWNLASSAVWRNSQDYFPARPETQGLHLVTNALNALWSSSFALPDWDMFHSGSEAGWFHGAARAISGGPVYISDKPGRHNARLLRALTLSGGRVPRACSPARVADSRILVDCLNEDRLLLVRNKTAAGFLLGVFHCRYTDATISDTWSPSDAGAEGKVVVAGFRSGQCAVMESGEAGQISLHPLGWEIFTIVPLANGIAPLGIDGKLAGAAAISKWEAVTEDIFRVELLDGGDLRVWSDKSFVARLDTSSNLPVRQQSEDVWIITVPEGKAATITITVKSEDAQKQRASSRD